MKSVIKENDTKKEIIYPCLMIGEHTGVVVLFHKEKHGIALNHSNIYGFCHYSDCWEMSTFKPFNGTIELSNN